MNRAESRRGDTPPSVHLPGHGHMQNCQPGGSLSLSVECLLGVFHRDLSGSPKVKLILCGLLSPP